MQRCKHLSILVRRDITVIATPQIQVTFKNCAPFTKFNSKIDGTTIDAAEDLDLVIPMYNLIEYDSNYSETTDVYGFILKMKRLLLIIILQTLIILTLSIIRINYEKTQLLILYQLQQIAF